MREITSRRQSTAYFAAPLFNEMERCFNQSVVREIEPYLKVFLPQRDGGLVMELIKRGLPPEDAAKVVFEKDRKAMEKSDVLIAVLDGATIDEGVAFEIGYMFGLGKYCLGLQTDLRRALPIGNNPMISASLHMVCHIVQALIASIREHQSQWLQGRQQVKGTISPIKEPKERLAFEAKRKAHFSGGQ